VTNLDADRWMKVVHSAAEATSGDTRAPELDRWRGSARPVWSLAAAIAITLALVFTMVVKSTLF
jgi:hypothetical protein